MGLPLARVTSAGGGEAFAVAVGGKRSACHGVTDEAAIIFHAQGVPLAEHTFPTPWIPGCALRC